MIGVQVNGRQVELDAPTPLVEYLERLGVDPRAVAVEHNGTILERADYATAVLRAGDVVEIVRMVGGGSSSRAHPHPQPLPRRAREGFMRFVL
jgi:thiamine biosynthesis protein ThiS